VLRHLNITTHNLCVEEFAWTANVFDCESRRDVAYRAARTLAPISVVLMDGPPAAMSLVR
jgi:hypothetical protein